AALAATAAATPAAHTAMAKASVWEKAVDVREVMAAGGERGGRSADGMPEGLRRVPAGRGWPW
ncbi:hypothetical protein DCC79_12470, partial [bacterium]